MSGLNGAKILVTRPRLQAEGLCRLIGQQGGVAVRFPTVDIVASGDIRSLEKLKQLNRYDDLVFVSANAVNFADQAIGGTIRGRVTVRVIAIGPATAKALQNVGVAVDLMPDAPFTSEALLAMVEMTCVRDKTVLIIRGEDGREDLAKELQRRGACVEYANVYKRVLSNVDPTLICALLQNQELAVVTATSVQILQNLLTLVGESGKQQLLLTPLVVVSSRIKNMAESLGFEQVAVAESPSDAAILKTVTTYLTGG